MFEIGKEYKRREEIHLPYGGQRQGGISTPKDKPYIFLFTSDSGGKHGYKDEYRDDGVFWYTGEGQIGDMEMVSGNKAILTHTEQGKTLHVFEESKRAYVRYIGTAECLGYHVETRPDNNADDRDAFVFHLDINSVKDGEFKRNLDKSDPKELKCKSIEELRTAALSKPPGTVSTSQKRRIAYYRSEALKLYISKRTKGICEGCTAPAPFDSREGPYLECHHIYRLADGGPDHPENVVGLCPNCHRRAHFAKDAKNFNESLQVVALKTEKMLKAQSSSVGTSE